MDDNFFVANSLSQTNKPKKDRKFSFKKKTPLQSSQKVDKPKNILNKNNK